MTNNELKEIIREQVGEDEADNIIVLEGDEFADGCIGISEDNRLVYSFEKLVESLSKQEGITETDAIEWLEYHTIRSLPYMASYGNVPIIMHDLMI